MFVISEHYSKSIFYLSIGYISIFLSLSRMKYIDLVDQSIQYTQPYSDRTSNRDEQFWKFVNSFSSKKIDQIHGTDLLKIVAIK